MYIIQNALKNVVRNKGRNILLGVTIFAIIATTAVTLIINNTANGIIEDYRNRFGSRVNIAMNQEDLFSNLDYIRSYGRPQLTPQQSLALTQSPHIMSYEMTANQGVTSPYAVCDNNPFAFNVKIAFRKWWLDITV